MSELRTCRDLGISRKRFNGWTPSTMDMVEWDEQERAWMIALRLYEDTRVCPLCGLDMRVCHDEEAFRKKYQNADVLLCFASEMREKAMKQYASSGLVESPNSVTTKLNPRHFEVSEA